ncbi:hypothetical protein BDAP_001787 [Binucleata daphniae]
MEDCYYFLYSSCKKEKCEFRHSQEAKNSQILCTKWKKNGECDVNCKYRHSKYHLSKKRNEIECYWYKNGECTKEDCEYKHAQEQKKKNEIECYWYKNGECTKEDCEYKHTQEPKKKNEIECCWYKNGECTKEDCEYKHAQEPKKKNEIECYWYKNGECTKEDCEYKHTQEPKKDKNKRKAFVKSINDDKNKNFGYIIKQQDHAVHKDLNTCKLKRWDDKDAYINKRANKGNDIQNNKNLDNNELKTCDNINNVDSIDKVDDSNCGVTTTLIRVIRMIRMLLASKPCLQILPPFNL